jgi:hypothetical protein
MKEWSPTMRLLNIVTTFVLSCVVLAGCQSPATQITVENVGFVLPECAIHYAAGDLYLVSNMHEGPMTPDGTGFISAVRPDGTVLDLKWIDGAKTDITLRSPKGMAIHNSKLYIGDIDQVQVFALPSCKQVASITVKGAGFLNDVAVGKDGSIYVTDTGITFTDGEIVKERIGYVFEIDPRGKSQILFHNKELEQPNGILVDGEDLIVASWGGGNMLRFDAQGECHVMPMPPKGGLDAVVKTNEGQLMTTSQAGDAIYALGKDQRWYPFAEDLKGLGDMGYDATRNCVLAVQTASQKLLIIPVK